MKYNFFKHAKNMAAMADFHKSPTGCVIVYKNKVISTGFNSSKTHPIQRKYNDERFVSNGTPHCMHAEVYALCSLINNTEINWSKVSVYTYREHKNREKAMARPCKSCMKLIKDLGIINIYYTTEGGYAHEVLDKA